MPPSWAWLSPSPRSTWPLGLPETPPRLGAGSASRTFRAVRPALAVAGPSRAGSQESRAASGGPWEEGPVWAGRREQQDTPDLTPLLTSAPVLPAEQGYVLYCCSLTRHRHHSHCVGIRTRGQRRGWLLGWQEGCWAAQLGFQDQHPMPSTPGSAVRLPPRPGLLGGAPTPGQWAGSPRLSASPDARG